MHSIPQITRRLLALLALAVLLSESGCAEDSLAPVADSARAGLLFPASGDTVEGRIEAAAWANLGETVRQVELVADGKAVRYLDNPPWSFAWEPSGQQPRFIELGVRARGETREALSAAQRVWFRPASPPEIRIRRPAVTRTLFAEEGVLLHAYACDTEDGELDPRTFRWSSSAGRTALGASFPVVVLPEGWHEVIAWAEDSDGNTASELQRIRVVREEGQVGPEPVARDFVRALNALDVDRLQALLHSDFEVVPCPANESASRLSREEFINVCEAVSAEPTLDDLRWDGRLVSPSEPGRDWALVDWSPLGIEKTTRSVAEGSETCADRNDRTTEFRATGISARFTLRRTGPSHWQIWRWQEMSHGGTAGLVAILREHLRP